MHSGGRVNKTEDQSSQRFLYQLHSSNFILLQYVQSIQGRNAFSDEQR